MIGFMLYFGLLLMPASTSLLLYQCFCLTQMLLPDGVVQVGEAHLGAAVAHADAQPLHRGRDLLRPGLRRRGHVGGGSMVFAVGSPFCFINPNDTGLQISFVLVPISVMVIVALIASIYICAVLI